MRAAASVFWVGVVILSRMYRADTAVMLWVVLDAVLAVAVATVVQVVPLVLTWMLKARVLKAVFSPPAPACCTTNRLMFWLEPRSTCRNLVAADVQNLSVLPPLTVPLTALAGPSLALQAALPVAGLFRA